MRTSFPALRLLSPILFVCAATLGRTADAPAHPAHTHAGQPAAHAAASGHTSDAGTELGDRMDEMGDAFKALRKQVDDASKNAASLELVAKLKKNATTALELVPAKAADLPEADRPKFVSNYRKEMKKLLELIDELQTSLQAGDNAKAAKVLREMGAHQKESHREFRRPQD